MPNSVKQRNSQGIRLSKAALESLMDRLDLFRSTGRELRTSRRHTFRRYKLAIDLMMPQGVIREQAVSRNISQIGMSLMLGRFVHVDTRVVIFLATESKILTRIHGNVVRCRMIDGTPFVHEAGIAFDQPVDIELFSSDLRVMRVLVIEPDELAADILSSAMHSHGYDVECTPSPAAAESLIDAYEQQSRPLNLILVNDDSELINGCDFIRQMRSDGYALPIVGIGSLAPEVRRRRCEEQNCIACNPIPMAVKSVDKLAHELRRRPFTSALAGDKNASRMIERLVAQMPESLKQLQIAFNNIENRDPLVAQLNRLHMFAEHCGFDEICVEIESLQNLIADHCDDVALRAELTKLVNICTAAHAPSIP